MFDLRKILFITIPTVLIFLIALELCLRLCGYFYVQRHNPEPYAKTAAFSKDEFRILCLGDSNTFGMGANPEASYPRQMEKILQKNVSEKMKVINGGRLANTSSLLLKRLQADIDQHAPSMIIVLIGASNTWNLEDSSYFLLNRNSMSFSQKLEELLSSTAIYKFLRIGLEKLRAKTEVDPKRLYNNDPNQQKDPRLSELIRVGSDFYREGKNDLTIQKAREALQIDRSDYAARLLLAQGLKARGEHQLAKEELWQTIRSVKEWDANLICGISHQFRGMNSNDDLVLFKKYLRENVEKKKSDALIKLIEASVDLYENEKAFRAVLVYDLEQIVKLVEKGGMKLVLQTYPLGGIFNLNSIIKEVSQKYGVELIDNEMLFKGKPRSEFIAPDLHCNEKGYGLMAENIYETLVKKEMLPVVSAGARADGR